MRTLYFDCFSGISGDMTLGALLDLGIDEQLFRKELEKLNLREYELKVARKSQSGIEGNDVHVILTGEKHGDHDHQHGEYSYDHEHSHDHGHPHHHDHHHGDGQGDHTHTHAHDHEHGHDEGHGAHQQHDGHRNLYDIEKIIDSSTLEEKVKTTAKEIFKKIAAAEGKVHGKPLHEVHFHEVGAVDSIVDIVGAAICLNILGVDRVIASPLSEGRGFIKCQHGLIPVPVPAVLEIAGANRIPLVQVDVNTELVTPTGAGILAYLAESFGNMPLMRIIKTGYGMGKRETGRPNMLRVVLGEDYDPGQAESGQVTVLETNIDDMNPEILGYTMEKLLEKGARDVFFTPIYMKKNRPAVMLSVICDEGGEDMLVRTIMEETTTLGIRKYSTQRYIMARETRKVETAYGTIKVKVAALGTVSKASPEYEDCKAVATAKGIPLKDVYAAAMNAYNRR